MAWREKITDQLTGYLRFIARAAFLIGGIVIASSFVYILIKACWFSLCYLDRTLFAEPW
jgi:hypothetical protein